MWEDHHKILSYVKQDNLVSKLNLKALIQLWPGGPPIIVNNESSKRLILTLTVLYKMYGCIAIDTRNKTGQLV